MSLGRTSPASHFQPQQGAGKVPQPEPGADQAVRGRQSVPSGFLHIWNPLPTGLVQLRLGLSGAGGSSHRPAPLLGLPYTAEMIKLIKPEQTDAGRRGALTWRERAPWNAGAHVSHTRSGAACSLHATRFQSDGLPR